MDNSDCRVAHKPHRAPLRWILAVKFHTKRRGTFDRPAFIDDFNYELSLADFLTALGDTVLFLQTGFLRDRFSQQLLRGSYPLNMLPPGECKKLRTQVLRELKSLRAEAIKHNKSGQLNASLAPEYNARRYAVLAVVNKGLATHGLSPIRPQYQV